MPDDADAISIRMISGLDQIAAEDWDSCADPDSEGPGRAENPFLTHRFLSALEESGSVSEEAGWIPRHLVAETSDGQLLGVAPLYVKTNSQGEYVFDYGWADAFERAGGKYYPKLQCAVPFTPVTGRRFLTPPGPQSEAIQSAMAQAAAQIAVENDLSSLHVTFCTEAEQEQVGEIGLLKRQDQQFHFLNNGYADFDAFLASLSSRKRKQIRKERATALMSGVEIVHLTGDALEPEHWEAFWDFYQDTGSRKWGRPYLTRAFFDLVQRDMRDDALLVMARREGEWVAGALNFIGREALYGRYWGCTEDHPCLHFEVCYYQAIDIALARGLSRVEAGAQGAHKLARGYMPTATRSLHWIAHPGLRGAVARYLEDEREMVEQDIEAMGRLSPFKRGDGGGGKQEGGSDA